MDLFIVGAVSQADIDDWVDKWHDDSSIEKQLHEYLGLSWDEYEIWALEPSKLSKIAEKRIL